MMNVVATLVGAWLGSSVPPAQALAEPPDPLSFFPARPGHGTGVPAAIVEAELAEVDAKYPRLEPVTRLPDFLSVDDVLALARSHDREQLRAAIHEQLDRRDGETLRGGYLEDPPSEGPDRRVYVLWIHDHLDQVFVSFDPRGRVLQRRTFYRAVLRRADILALHHGADVERPRQALIVERITTSSVCCLSVRWEVYRVTDRGALARVADIPKSHYDVGPGVQYTYLNHVAFEADRLVLTPLDPDLPSDGTRTPYVLPYRPERRQFVPSPATARRLLADHRDPHELE